MQFRTWVKLFVASPSNWVSWQLNKSYLGRVDRQNNFRPDDTLPTGFTQVTPNMYARSGYDKGHVIRQMMNYCK